MTDELKPCPFCGGRNIRDTGRSLMGVADTPDTYCVDCKAMGPDHGGMQGWNTRADTPDVANEEARHINRDALEAMTKRAEEAEAKLAEYERTSNKH
jgi:hypothetical protein